VVKQRSPLYGGIRSIRALFEEKHTADRVDWFCRLCPFAYNEQSAAYGWPISVEGLFKLTLHVRRHQQA
jgi:hypothetical protein